MGAAAELHREAVRQGDHPHHVPVFFAEQGHGPQPSGLIDGHFADLNRHGLQYFQVDQALYPGQLLGGEGGEVGEVEAHMLLVYQLAGLLHMAAQHLAQSGLQQVGGSVVAHGVEPLGLLHLGGNRVSLAQGALADLDPVEEDPLVPGDVNHVYGEALGFQLAAVSGLAAALAVEGGAVQDHGHLGPLSGGFDPLAVLDDGQHLGLAGKLGIANELGGGQAVDCPALPLPGVGSGVFPGGAGPLLLLAHQLLEAFLVHQHTPLGQDLLGQVQGEAKGVVKGKGAFAGEHFALRLVNELVEHGHALVDGALEALLLIGHHLADGLPLLPQLGVGPAVLLNHRVHHVLEEGPAHPQQPAVAGGPAQQAAEHIAPALVGGEDAVANHEHGGAHMVGDDAQGDVGFGALAVLYAGNLADFFHDVLDRVHQEQVVHPLHHAGQALHAQARVDILPPQGGVIALAVAVELGEHQVPDLNVAVAVAAQAAGRLAAAMLGAPVEENLGAGAAGAAAVLPEVVLTAQTLHVALGHAHLFCPDVPGVVICLEHGDIQLFLGDFQHLGEELPGPGNGLPLEVVVEAEIAQHLEKGAVAVCDAHAVNVWGADALLAGCDPVAGGLCLAGEVLLHGGHARADEQQAGVSLGNQGEAGQPQVALALKKAQIFFSQFVQSGPLHLVSSPSFHFIIFGNPLDSFPR